MTRTVVLFAIAALLEIIGCWSVMYWLKVNKSPFVLFVGLFTLAAFAGLLSLHTAPSGRVYATYGGIYILVSFAWLCLVDQVRPTATDVTGVCLALLGALVISSQIK